MIGFGVLVASIAVAVLALVLSARPMNARLSASPLPTSPIDEAERILAGRYARGIITAEEYGRMLAILRH